jgi:hypothetical protein
MKRGYDRLSGSADTVTRADITGCVLGPQAPPALVYTRRVHGEKGRLMKGARTRDVPGGSSTELVELAARLRVNAFPGVRLVTRVGSARGSEEEETFGSVIATTSMGRLTNLTSAVMCAIWVTCITRDCLPCLDMRLRCMLGARTRTLRGVSNNR